MKWYARHPVLGGLIAVALVMVVISLFVDTGSNSDGETKPNRATQDCDVMRRAIQRDKAEVITAEQVGDTVGAAKQRREVDADARAARSIEGCDISDLVGANVGR